MAEQQLIDYITKAKGAGQTDEQTRNLLLKNGWTEAEVGDAFSSLAQPQIQPQVQPQVQNIVQPNISVQPQVIAQPEPEVSLDPEIQPQVQTQPQAQPEIQPQPQQPQYQPQPINVQSDMPQTRAKSHTILKLFIVLIIVAVIGGAGYVVAGKYLNLNFSFNWNPFAESPKSVINKMITTMQGKKSFRSIMQMEIDATDNATKSAQGNLTLNTDTQTNITDVKNPKANGTLTINIVVPGSVSSNISASVNMTYIGSALYFKVNTITIPNTLSIPGINTAQITGKWFKLDQDSYKAMSQAQGSQVIVPDVSQVNSSALSLKVQNLITAEDMFNDVKKLNDEVVSGQNTNHYSVTISKDKIKDLMAKLMALETQEIAKTQTSNTADNSSIAITQSLMQSFTNTFVDGIGDINVEMWIGKKDYILYEYKIDKTIDLSKLLGSNLSLDFKVNDTYSNFDKIVAIQEPVGAQKFENIILPLLKGDQVHSDLQQIGFDAQSSFNTSNNYSSLCYKGMLNGYLTTYGKDLVNLNNDIVSHGAKKPSCYSSEKDYCVSIQVADGSYLCVDKSGILGKTKCISATTACK